MFKIFSNKVSEREKEKKKEREREGGEAVLKSWFFFFRLRYGGGPDTIHHFPQVVSVIQSLKSRKHSISVLMSSKERRIREPKREKEIETTVRLHCRSS